MCEVRHPARVRFLGRYLRWWRTGLQRCGRYAPAPVAAAESLRRQQERLRQMGVGPAGQALLLGGPEVLQRIRTERIPQGAYGERGFPCVQPDRRLGRHEALPQSPTGFQGWRTAPRFRLREGPLQCVPLPDGAAQAQRSLQPRQRHGTHLPGPGSSHVRRTW